MNVNENYKVEYGTTITNNYSEWTLAIARRYDEELECRKDV